MTVGTVTMSRFGWLALCMEMACIVLKDISLWSGSLTYRYGIKRKRGNCVFYILYFSAVFGSEYGGLTGQGSVMFISISLFMLMLYLCTENGLELMGRNQVYWMICYVPWTVIELLTALPVMSEGSISYYEAPGRILPNIAILMFSFLLMKYLWKRKALEWVPKNFCIALSIAAYFVLCVRFLSMVGKARFSLLEIRQPIFIFLGFISTTTGCAMFYSLRQKHRMHLAVQCRRQFYQQMRRVQREAGKFRHDLANHIQVLSIYDEEAEKEKYEGKLKERKEELQIRAYSQNAVMDFILNQVQDMAAQNGCILSVQWEAGGVSEEEIRMITDRCLEYLTRHSHRWRFLDHLGKKTMYQITICRQRSGSREACCGLNWSRIKGGRHEERNHM